MLSDLDVFLKLALERRSVRQFTGEAVSIELLRPALEAFRFAPSAGNKQPWRVLIREQEKIQQIGRVSAQAQIFEGAGALLVVYANPFESWAHVRGGIGAPWQHAYMNDLGAATQNLLLAVHAAGLGAVWVGYFDQIRLDEIIKRPRELQPLALVPVGHYDRAKSHGKDQRRPAPEIFFSEDLEHPLDI